ncbi:methylated-DNA--[protein]-cysteine S-methyltransferase [Streptomyces chumphonensis]|uniref:Methylated-DNA--protein-cysteine methyltransferase n=1 Tax=Streptomyces chumphonensis TaxID=1214925 RepID=A0A927EUY0_9ACTN|nr:methylated-DNA--[protein]-cysteine S-methyltransferase [Streptomyces chumphonensis]MBD3930114.1 methylated-DNA--[protein]-cysteine S-methyltransferase [Streptomyces chumphonensis]
MTATYAQPAWTVVPAPVGPLLLLATDTGLAAVGFHAEGPAVPRALDRFAGPLGTEPVERAGHPVLRRAARELDGYFAGRLRTFGVPLDWSLTGGFTARVLHALAATVPYGAVATYQDLADAVGEPGAARAVGAAMGANPLPVVVPCHRVVASGGGIGGFGGGLEAKRTLLALEGVLPAPLF